MINKHKSYWHDIALGIRLTSQWLYVDKYGREQQRSAGYRWIMTISGIVSAIIMMYYGIHLLQLIPKCSWGAALSFYILTYCSAMGRRHERRTTHDAASL
jgi:hypothetical protein